MLQHRQLFIIIYSIWFNIIQYVHNIHMFDASGSDAVVAIDFVFRPRAQIKWRLEGLASAFVGSAIRFVSRLFASVEEQVDSKNMQSLVVVAVVILILVVLCSSLSVLLWSFIQCHNVCGPVRPGCAEMPWIPPFVLYLYPIHVVAPVH